VENPVEKRSKSG